MVLGVLIGSFLSSLVEGGNSLFNFFKGVIWKKSLKNPGSDGRSIFAPNICISQN